jgi:ABC-type lipoprotein release transport system permease subunit
MQEKVLAGSEIFDGDPHDTIQLLIYVTDHPFGNRGESVGLGLLLMLLASTIARLLPARRASREMSPIASVDKCLPNNLDG